MSINFFIKTRRIVGDRRIEKEWSCFNDKEIAVNLFYAANDEVEIDVADFELVKKINLPGGAAPLNLVMRLFGAVIFCIWSFFKVWIYSSSKVHWVNDPILFPLVILLSYRSSDYIIWDHHELPPDWIFKNGLVKYFFQVAYKRASCIVHTNLPRKELLEQRLKYNHPNVMYLPNYPKKSEMAEYKAVELPQSFQERQFVLLQSTFGAHRADIEIFSAIKKAGLIAVHAGSIDSQRLNAIEAEVGSLDFCEFIGHRSIEEINWLLKNCLCTIIFYKNTSSNNWLCDPNRLYQSIAQNVWVITGRNPTSLLALKGYKKVLEVDLDLGNVDQVHEAIAKIIKFDSLKLNDGEVTTFASSYIPNYWENFSSVFDHVEEIERKMSMTSTNKEGG